MNNHESLKMAISETGIKHTAGSTSRTTYSLDTVDFVDISIVSTEVPYNLEKNIIKKRFKVKNPKQAFIFLSQK